jgi:cell division protease FtsH
VSIQTNEEVSAAAEMAFDVVTTTGLYPDSKFAPHFDMAVVHELRIPRENMEKGTLDLIVRGHTKGRELIKEYAPLIERVANELMENERLYGSTVREMVKKYQQEELGGNFTRTPSYYERAGIDSASSNFVN